jgi:hypothetical protein
VTIAGPWPKPGLTTASTPAVLRMRVSCGVMSESRGPYCSSATIAIPAALATRWHCVRMDWPKPSVPLISPTRDRPRARMSAKIFSQAILSVCGVLKVKGATGSMISIPPARLMKGMRASSKTGRIAMVVPVVVPPTIATTRSSSTRRVAKVRARFASPPSS